MQEPEEETDTGKRRVGKEVDKVRSFGPGSSAKPPGVGA